MAEYKAVIEITIKSKDKEVKSKELIDCDIKEGIERLCGHSTVIKVINSTLKK